MIISVLLRIEPHCGSVLCKLAKWISGTYTMPRPSSLNSREYNQRDSKEEVGKLSEQDRFGCFSARDNFGCVSSLPTNQHK